MSGSAAATPHGRFLGLRTAQGRSGGRGLESAGNATKRAVRGSSTAVVRPDAASDPGAPGSFPSPAGRRAARGHKLRGRGGPPRRGKGSCSATVTATMPATSPTCSSTSCWWRCWTRWRASRRPSACSTRTRAAASTTSAMPWRSRAASTSRACTGCGGATTCRRRWRAGASACAPRTRRCRPARRLAATPARRCWPPGCCAGRTAWSCASATPPSSRRCVTASAASGAWPCMGATATRRCRRCCRQRSDAV